MNEEEKLAQAVIRTQVLRSPRQALATFGVTTVSYYILTRPSYAEEEASETVVRMGKVVANRPRIVTPYYLSRLDGFSADARRYFEKLIETHGADAPGIYYTYRNEPGGTDIISNGLDDVLAKINAEIDARNDPLAAVIRGEDTLWDVSLLKFIYEMTSSSVGSNLADLHSRGLLGMEGVQHRRGPPQYRGHVPPPQGRQHRTPRAASGAGALGPFRVLPGQVSGGAQEIVDDPILRRPGPTRNLARISPIPRENQAGCPIIARRGVRPDAQRPIVL